LGGHGFIREWGLEQWVRDTRIAQIYEGTNGVQAHDLMGRKVAKNNGVFVASYLAEIRAFNETLAGDAPGLHARGAGFRPPMKSKPRRSGWWSSPRSTRTKSTPPPSITCTPSVC
jgi:hypothetical protein